jgi:hypothetical protein
MAPQSRTIKSTSPKINHQAVNPRTRVVHSRNPITSSNPMTRDRNLIAVRAYQVTEAVANNDL